MPRYYGKYRYYVNKGSGYLYRHDLVNDVVHYASDRNMIWNREQVAYVTPQHFRNRHYFRPIEAIVVKHFFECGGYNEDYFRIPYRGLEDAFERYDNERKQINKAVKK